MSHIKNIEIKNFKSVRHVIIEDCRRVNVFIGYPNVGKSNVLEAMSLISYIDYKNTGISYKSLCRFKELIDIFYDGDKKNPIEINVDGFLLSLEFKSKEEIKFNIKDLDISSRDIIASSPEGAAGLLSGIRRDYKIDKQGSVRFQTTTNSYIYDIPILKKYHFKDSHLDQQENPTVLSFPYGRNLSEIIRYNNQLRRECGELFSNYGLKIVFDKDENITVQKELDEFSAFQISLEQVAETLQRLIFHKAAIATNTNTVLLFEEPEAHMFPPYITKLTADILLDKNKNQYFITTHSPFVLNDFMEDMDTKDLAIYAVGYKKRTGETIIRRLSDKEVDEIYQYGVDLFFNLDNYLVNAI